MRRPTHRGPLRVAAVAVVVLVGLVGACSGAPAELALVSVEDIDFTVDATPQGFQLDWNPDAVPASGSLIQVAEQRPADRGWEDPGDWTAVPLDDATPGHTTFAPVTPGRRYRFRMRMGKGDWTESVTRLHVAPDLPVVRIRTDNPDVAFDDTKTYRDATVGLDTPDQAAAVDRPARIRTRGYSTLEAVPGKFSYQMVFDDPVGLLGMNPARRWVLLANYFDPTQVRNYTAMQIAQATDLAWTPAMDWVEVYLDGDYQGVYNLFEKVDVGPTKVDVEPPGPRVTSGEALTGGYLLQLEWQEKDHKQSWVTGRQVRVNLQRPKADASNAAQLEYIRDHVERFETALFSDEFTDPETGYRRYLDTDSFIDLWIVQELTANSDAYNDSLYFFKRRGDDKLHFGPAWDFDNALGSRFQPFTSPTQWHTLSGSDDPVRRRIGRRAWLYRLFEDPWFQSQAAERWHALRPALHAIPDRVVAAADTLETAIGNDWLRWKDAEDTRLIGQVHRYGDLDEVDDADHIATWLRERIVFITDRIDSAGAVIAPG